MNHKYRTDAMNAGSNQESTLDTSLKVAWVAGLFSTIGDVLAVYAASLAIEEAIEDEAMQIKKEQQLEARITGLEQQLESIQNKLETK